ncbi:MAG: hypothetical protein K9L26_00230 [Candidatus Izimaplasma sp.]|nr:hypothetical protein [Candidatus Izimaplasma bacterium]
MKAIIVHSLSKHKRSLTIAKTFDGDVFEITPVKKSIAFYPFQLIVYGYLTARHKAVAIHPIDIDYSKYDKIVLVSPVWAGQVNVFMRQFLKNYPLYDKTVTIVGSCDGGYKNYFNSFETLIDDSNQITNQIMYVKGIRQ